MGKLSRFVPGKAYSVSAGAELNPWADLPVENLFDSDIEDAADDNQDSYDSYRKTPFYDGSIISSSPILTVYNFFLHTTRFVFIRVLRI